MKSTHRLRRIITLFIILLTMAIPIATAELPAPVVPQEQQTATTKDTITTLNELPVKGRAPKTGYERTQFGNGWGRQLGCDTRNTILRRDLTEITSDKQCKVLSGTLKDPYTNRIIVFQRGLSTSDDVQIDHVVALSNAWQTGAQQLPYVQRVRFANDPLNLLAVEGKANEQKSDGDAATWLPSNKLFRCQYVARQIAVKTKYALWVTSAEKSAMARVLATCK